MDTRSRQKSKEIRQIEIDLGSLRAPATSTLTDLRLPLPLFEHDKLSIRMISNVAVEFPVDRGAGPDETES